MRASRHLPVVAALFLLAGCAAAPPTLDDQPGADGGDAEQAQVLSPNGADCPGIAEWWNTPNDVGMQAVETPEALAPFVAASVPDCVLEGPQTGHVLFFKGTPEEVVARIIAAGGAVEPDRTASPGAVAWVRYATGLESGAGPINLLEIDTISGFGSDDAFLESSAITDVAQWSMTLISWVG